MPRPFRFGLNALHPTSPTVWRETARKVEALGYSSFVVADHVGTTLAPLTSMVAAAEATTTIKIGSYVFANDFWHPTILAREIATIDVLSGGRLEFGFGTGYEAEDYQQRGITKDSPNIQVSRFAEAIQVVKGLFGAQPLTYLGQYYTINGYNALPKPLQQPHPPILIGGGGRRMLSLAVREATIVGVNATSSTEAPAMTAESTDQQIAWIREMAGTRFDQLELNNIVLVVRVTEDRRAAAEQFNRDFSWWKHGLSIDQMLESPYMLFGTIDQICEQLQQRRERFGISYLTVYDEDQMDIFAPVVARLAGT